MQFLDLLDIDHGGAADAQETLGGQLAFQRSHGFPQHVGFISHVQLDVVVRRFDPINVGQPQKDNPSIRFDRESLRQQGLRLQIRQKSRQAPLNCSSVVALDLAARAVQGGLETLHSAGLDQVIHRMHVKSPQGEIVVGSNEDDGGHPCGVDLRQYPKSIQFRHSHIQEHQVRRQ